MQTEFLNLLSARQGHFRYESGYHGDIWFDLDLLFLQPRAVHPFAVALARRLAPYRLDAICGPLVGGALVAQTVASELDIEFYYTERFVRPQSEAALYPVEYRLPEGVRRRIAGKRTAILDDVISAGSAVRGTLAELQAWGVGSVVMAALLVMGASMPAFCAEHNIPLEHIATLPANLWLPPACPLCRAQVPMEDITADSSRFPPKSPTNA